ncbi:MAG TPA: hypothetical protein VI139_08985 [Gemmatimonadales bacterium]
MTTTVPDIDDPCTKQSYVYVPACEKVWAYEPLVMMAEFVGSVPGAVSHCTPCDREAGAQVHVTVPPTAIVTLSGANTIPGPTVTPAVRGAVVMVAVKVTGDPESDGVEVAVTVSGPGLEPSVCVVTATPLTPVEFDVGLLDPPPATTAQVTVTPLTGFP